MLSLPFMLACACAAFGSTNVVLPPCTESGPSESVRLKYVVDGDTLVLADGRKVRLIGVNAPELAHGGQREEAGARSAVRFAQHFLGAEGLRIQPGRARFDRYGRLLAHVYRSDGANLEAALLSAGMALQIVFPPNVDQIVCQSRAEASARTRRTGLWGSGAFRPVTVSSLASDAAGFHLLRGRVSAVARTRKTWWIEIDDRVSLRIASEDWRYFNWRQVQQLTGQQVEVRGWLVRRQPALQNASHERHPPWVMSVHHPVAIVSENLQ